MKTLKLFALLMLWLLPTVPAAASVTEYVQSSAWQDAVDSYVSIGFTGWPPFTLITDQYSSLGVVFPSNDCQIQWISNDPFYSDGSGLVGQTCGFYGLINAEFAEPRYAFAVDFASFMQIDLFMQGTLLYSSDVFSSTSTTFAGVISTLPFDRVVMRNVAYNSLYIDNIYFGAPLPAPSALGLFAITAYGRSSRKRSINSAVESNRLLPR